MRSGPAGSRRGGGRTSGLWLLAAVAGLVVSSGWRGSAAAPAYRTAPPAHVASTFFSAKADLRGRPEAYVGFEAVVRCASQFGYPDRKSASMVMGAIHVDPYLGPPEPYEWWFVVGAYEDNYVYLEASAEEHKHMQVTLLDPPLYDVGTEAYEFGIWFRDFGTGWIRLAWAGWWNARVDCTLAVDGQEVEPRAEPPERAVFVKMTDFGGGAGVDVWGQTAGALGRFQRYTDGYLFAFMSDRSRVTGLRAGLGQPSMRIDGPQGEHYDNGRDADGTVFVRQPTRGVWTYSFDLTVGGRTPILWILEPTL